MSLSDTIHDAWGNVVRNFSHETEPNISLLAFQFCEAIQTAGTMLGVSYDGLNPGHPNQPNLVVWLKGNEPEVLFFGSLVCPPVNHPESSKLVERWTSIIAEAELDVLIGNHKDGASYMRMPLSAEFEFGLYVIGNSEGKKYAFRDFIGPLTHLQLKRFHFAQHATGATTKAQDTSYRRPPDPAEYASEKRLPKLTFHIGNEREVHVHAFVFEPCYSRRGVIYDDASVEMTAATQAVHKGGMFGVREIVVLPAAHAEVDPPRYPNTVITAWLWSSPLSEASFCSEVVVEFMAEYKPNVPMEELFANALLGFDWEELAEDVTCENIQWWDDNWYFEAQ